MGNNNQMMMMMMMMLMLIVLGVVWTQTNVFGNNPPPADCVPTDWDKNDASFVCPTAPGSLAKIITRTRGVKTVASAGGKECVLTENKSCPAILSSGAVVPASSASAPAASTWNVYPNKLFRGFAYLNNVTSSLNDAKDQCARNTDCVGLIEKGNSYQLLKRFKLNRINSATFNYNKNNYKTDNAQGTQKSGDWYEIDNSDFLGADFAINGVPPGSPISTTINHLLPSTCDEKPECGGFVQEKGTNRTWFKIKPKVDTVPPSEGITTHLYGRDENSYKDIAF